MNTPARICLRLGTLLLALMVTLLWAGPRAKSSTAMGTIDVSDPTVQLAFGVLQSDMLKAKLEERAPVMPAKAARHVPVAPAVSDLMLPDEIVNVIAPAQKAAIEQNACEDV